MRGTILGYDGTSGAISGEDGTRYSFESADWKGERPPQPRDNVDFVASDGAAREVYLVKTALGGLGDKLGGGLPQMSGTGAQAFFAERPQVIVAGLVILVSVLLTFASGLVFSFGDAMMGRSLGSGTTAVGFPGAMNGLISQISAYASFGRGGAPSTGMLGFAAMLSYLLYLIPVLAVAMIYFDAINQRKRVLELSLGGLCIGSLVIYFLNANAVTSMGGSSRAAMQGLISFSIGGYLLVACGILLVLTGLGKITRTPGL